MSIERTIQGYWRISAMVNNHRVQRLFAGYTKREAIAEFKRTIKAIYGVKV